MWHLLNTNYRHCIQWSLECILCPPKEGLLSQDRNRQNRRMRWTTKQMAAWKPGEAMDLTHNKEAILRRKKINGSLWVKFRTSLWAHSWHCPMPRHATLHSSLQAQHRHSHIPHGAGKAAAALKLQTSSYWHEKENREGTRERRGREGEKWEEGRERSRGKRTHFMCLFFFSFFFFLICFFLPFFLLETANPTANRSDWKTNCYGFSLVQRVRQDISARGRQHPSPVPTPTAGSWHSAGHCQGPSSPAQPSAAVTVVNKLLLIWFSLLESHECAGALSVLKSESRDEVWSNHWLFPCPLCSQSLTFISPLGCFSEVLQLELLEKCFGKYFERYIEVLSWERKAKPQKFPVWDANVLFFFAQSKSFAIM